MRIIADSGSTKTDWCIIEPGGIRTAFTTSGINPVVMDEDTVRRILREELMPHVTHALDIYDIQFFGAGCTPAKIPVIESLLRELFPHAYNMRVASDMLGAAIAACGRNEGIAAILGTGSNSCLFDGEKIVQNTPCLGFILGDEGGGAVMGKHFLNGILKRTLPVSLCDKFLSETGLTQETIISKVYRGEAPNRFLASMSPFIHDNLDVPELREMVVSNFRAFFRNNIHQYGHPDWPVNFVGSMAFHYQSELTEAAQLEGFQIGRLIKSPIDGLIEAL